MVSFDQPNNKLLVPSVAFAAPSPGEMDRACDAGDDQLPDLHVDAAYRHLFTTSRASCASKPPFSGRATPRTPRPSSSFLLGWAKIACPLDLCRTPALTLFLKGMSPSNNTCELDIWAMVSPIDCTDPQWRFSICSYFHGVPSTIEVSRGITMTWPHRIRWKHSWAFDTCLSRWSFFLIFFPTIDGTFNWNSCG